MFEKNNALAIAYITSGALVTTLSPLYTIARNSQLPESYMDLTRKIISEEQSLERLNHELVECMTYNYSCEFATRNRNFSQYYLDRLREMRYDVQHHREQYTIEGLLILLSGLPLATVGALCMMPKEEDIVIDEIPRSEQ